MTPTNIFLCFNHLPAHSHLARPPQHVSSSVEDLQIDHAAKTAGLSWIRTIKLHQAALQGLDQPCFDIHMAQDVVRSHHTLSSIVEARPGDSLCRGSDVTLLVHIARVFAAQNQGDRCERASCCLSHSASLFPVSWEHTVTFNTSRMIQPNKKTKSAFHLYLQRRHDQT